MEPSEVWTPERQALALAEAESWRGTPHRNRIAARGHGIDCIRFVCRVLMAAEVIESRTLPSYQTAHGIAGTSSKLANAFAACLDVERIPPDQWEPRFGDLCLWKVGGNSNHVAICLGRDVWHVSTNTPVGPMAVEYARRRMQEAQRIRRCGWTADPTALKMHAL